MGRSREHTKLLDYKIELYIVGTVRRVIRKLIRNKIISNRFNNIDFYNSACYFSKNNHDKFIIVNEDIALMFKRRLNKKENYLDEYAYQQFKNSLREYGGKGDGHGFTGIYLYGNKIWYDTLCPKSTIYAINLN